ncbi:MAG: tetratricopeptide repeat protein [Bacteroidota bacterium]
MRNKLNVLLVFLILLAGTQLAPAQSAQKWIKKGQKTGNLNEKLNCFRNAIEAEPDNAEAYYYFGITLLARGESELGLRALTRAIDIDPPYYAALLARGNHHTFILAWNLAEKDYLAAIRVDASRPEANLALAKLLVRKNEYESALLPLNRVLTQNPDAAEALLLRGECYHRTNQSPQAITDLKRVLELQTARPEVHLLLGQAQVQAGDTLRGLDHFRRGSRLDTTDADYHFQAASFLHEQELNREGIPFARRAAKLNPDEGAYRQLYGWTLSKTDDIEGAQREFKSAVKLQPYHAENWNALGHSFNQAGSFIKGIKYFDHALRLNDRLINAYDNRGYARRMTGLYAGAIEDYRLTIESQYNAVHNWINLAYTHLCLGNWEAAQKAAEEAMQLDPEHPFPYNNRGLAHLRQGNWPAAISDFDRSLARETSYAHLVLTNRAEAKCIGLDFRGAKKDLERALEIKPVYARATYLMRQLEKDSPDTLFRPHGPRTVLFMVIGQHAQDSASFENATQLADLFRRRRRSSSTELVLLHGPSVSAQLVLDSLQQTVGPQGHLFGDDQVIFFFSGNQGTWRNAPALSLDYAQGEAGILPEDDLVQVLETSRAGSKLVLVEGFNRTTADNPDEILDEGASSPIPWLASVAPPTLRGSEFAPQARFSHYLLAGLQRAADRDEDGVIFLAELADYLELMLTYETEEEEAVRLRGQPSQEMLLMLPD